MLREFHGKTAEQMVDPLLQQLDRALATDAMEFDPVVETAITASQTEAFRLTATAITNTYEDTLADDARWAAASLAAEDVRWLQLLQTIAAGHAD